jgi:ABC-2 type transport system ATP-binding protein
MTPAIDLSGVTKRYRSVSALDGVSFSVAPGEFFGLLGPNGAGKTTLISILAGLVRATSGRAAVMGHNVATDYRAARRALGVVPQELVFDPFFTVRESLEFQAGYFGLSRNGAWIDEVMHHLDLTSKANANMRSLSGGMKRRVLIGQALVHKPPVIVLDEPTAGVDVELRQQLWTFIRRLNEDGHTIVLTTHYLEEAEALCGRIAMLKGGRLVALDTKQNFLKRIPGCAVRVRLAEERLPAALAHLPVSRKDGSFLLQLADYGEVESVLKALRTAGNPVLELEVLQPDLEEVFVSIMGQGQDERQTTHAPGRERAA